MGKIRVLGQVRGGRCVFCHDALDDEGTGCAACGVKYHAECAAGATRCPTIGCGAAPPAAVAEAAAGRARGREEDVAPEERQRREDRARALFEGVTRAEHRLAIALVIVGLLAFFGPIVGVLGATVVLGHVHMEGFPAMFLCCVAPGFGLAALAGGAQNISRLAQLERDVVRLLGSSTPIAMDLALERAGPGGRWHARLAPIFKGAGEEALIKIDALPPSAWLEDHHRVLVHGAPPGPYVVEFASGEVAFLAP